MNHSHLTLKPIARAAAAALVLASIAAHAQQEQRVEITGSSIKRVASETALPVQVIRREDIEKSGVTTAAELLKNISASAAQLTDGASISDNTGGQRGFNGANLRGLGVSSTLVLLNGRRMANFASPGDSAGVDLNSIPAGAIQRVEVLKDGASAIYGTDAIGGVINFITRQDYQGVDIGAYAMRTQDGGAGKTTGTISAGLGNIAKDRFNVFGVLDVQKLDPLRSTQRDFIQERPLASTVPFYLSSRPYPGNIRLQSNTTRRAAQLAAVNAAGYTFSGGPFNQRTINFSAPTCNPPASVYTTVIGTQACGYDYMADTEIYPRSDKVSFLGRGVFQINADTQVFAELLKSTAKTKYVLSPNPTTLTGVTWSQINSYLPRPITEANNYTFDIRFRATEAGNRSNEVASDATRVVLGLSGSLGKDWDYTVAINKADNSTKDRYVNGYFKFAEFDAGVRTGSINPFGPSSAAGKTLIESLRIDDVARQSKGSTEAVDGKITGTLAELAGGSLGVAVGVELRRESQDFTPSALLISNNIAGDRRASLGNTPDPTIIATSNSRNIVSAYGELSAPLSKQLELQAALRFDKYDKIGSTVNPKLGVRWQPSTKVLVRGSAGTGFRAPSFSELYRPTVNGTSPAFIEDSLLGFDQWPTTKQANPELKPEKSKQFSLGIVVEPVRDVSLSVDYWNIRKTDVISDLYEKTILANPTRYAAYITRDAFDTPTVLLKKENQGKLQTSGIDVELNYRGAATSVGRFGANFSGTYIMEYKRQFGALEPLVSNLGQFLNDQVIQRWRHRISADWSAGDFGLTLGNTYFSGYTDDGYLPNTAPAKVKAYSLFDLSGSWAVSKQLQLRAGVSNLLNTEPPYSNQSYYFLSTYDPTYTDPRGRSFYASLTYSFR